MIDFEVRLNGALLGHIHVLNVTHLSPPDKQGRDTYDYALYEADTSRLRTGSVMHTRSSGYRPLLAAVLDNLAFGDKLDAARASAETPAPSKPKKRAKRRNG